MTIAQTSKKLKLQQGQVIIQPQQPIMDMGEMEL